MIELPIKGTDQLYRVHPEKIIAVGLNYHDHIEEGISDGIKGFKRNTPEKPVLFNKSLNVLTGPETEIRIPKVYAKYPEIIPRVDYEGELTVIISKDASCINPEESTNYIEGFTIMNDVTERNFQNADISGWFRGKSFDTFGPIGPCLVPPSLIEDPQNLDLETRLNGKLVQSTNTSLMIFSINELISFISWSFTLKQGDIILTGTPKGIGPMKSGDSVEISIEGIGVLKNFVAG